MNPDSFSDEFLNAFVDNQLAADDKNRAYLKIGQDENLNRQVCELRKMHELVQHAYRNPPPAPSTSVVAAKQRSWGMRAGIAATLVMGVVLGTQIKHLWSSQPAQSHAQILSPAPAATVVALPKNTDSSVNKQQALAVSLPSGQRASVTLQTPAVTAKASKVLIHVAADDRDKVGRALDDIESLLQYYRRSGQDARVEVVINGKGMELVRTDTSPYAARIQRLQREYDNLTFAACQNTIDRLKRERGIVVRLLPGVVVIDSGMAELMRRQNQGWAYIQV